MHLDNEKEIQAQNYFNLLRLSSQAETQSFMLNSQHKTEKSLVPQAKAARLHIAAASESGEKIGGVHVLLLLRLTVFS